MSSPQSRDTRLIDLPEEDADLLDHARFNRLANMLQPDEQVKAVYRAASGRRAVLTTHQLIILKSSSKPRVSVSLPLSLVSTSATDGHVVVAGAGEEVRLWGSNLDPSGDLLVAVSKQPQVRQSGPVTETSGTAAVRTASATQVRKTRTRRYDRIIPWTGVISMWLVAAALGRAGAESQIMTVAVGASTMALIGACFNWWRSRGAMDEPREPRLKQAVIRSVGPPPPSTIRESADYCVKCGRPLTNAESREARVGTECIKRWGPQYRNVQNPAYTDHMDRVIEAQVEKAAEQARFNAEHEAAMCTYADQAAAFAAWLDSPEGRRTWKLRLMSRGLARTGVAVPFVASVLSALI